MQNRGYTLYLYHYDKVVKYPDLEKLINKSGMSDNISFLDISEKSESEVYAEIGLLIIAERAREYHGNDDTVFAHFVRMHDESFLLVLSLYEEALNDRETLNAVSKFFYTNERATCVSLYGNEKKSSSESSIYWKEFFSSLPSDVFKPQKNEKMNMESERYFADENLSSLLGIMLSNGKTSLKSIITLIIGKLLCTYFNTSKILIEDQHIGGAMDRVPILVNSNLSGKDLYSNIMGQLSEAEKYDMITFEKLSEYERDSEYSKKVLASIDFKSDLRFTGFLKRMAGNKLYQISTAKYSKLPFSVDFFLTGNKLSATYSYDVDMFEKVNMEDFHNEFCRLLFDFLCGRDIVPQGFEAVSNIDKRKRVTEVKIDCLKKIGMFKKYTNQELRDLAPSCFFEYLNSKQEAISIKSYPENIYFVIKGTIEVGGLDSGKFLRPLYMLKKNDVFGIESILEDNRAMVQYSVYSDDAILLVFNKKEFLSECAKNPKLVMNLLEIQSKRLYKFEKLWTNA